MKIAIIALYFGNLPEFVHLFLASCNRNKSIDFFLVGDAWRAMESDVPENCHVRGINLDSFKSLAQKNTNIKPSFSSAYKLCDFKPALGDIFRDELKEYDYWGFCDTDIVVGDLNAFLSDLQLYDVFSTRHEFLSGPFFLMRNNEKVNLLYRNSKDIDAVLSSDRHYCFDECNFAWEPLRAGRSILEVETEIESMTEVIVRAVRAGSITAHFSTLSLEPERLFKGRIIVEKGHVRKDGGEYIHYHHLHNKGRSLYTYPRWHWAEVPDRYQITKYGVYAGLDPRDFPHRIHQFVDRWKRRASRLLKSRVFGATEDDNATKIT